MNPEKWKSVVITIDSYNVLKAMSRLEHRTISGQFTHLLEEVTKDQRNGQKPRANRKYGKA